MAAPQVFKVLTEFKFEVGSAVTSASQLEHAVKGVSDTAQNLQFQLARVGVGFAANLGLVGGGALGLLSKTLKQFNMIEQQQIKLGGILFANRGFLDGVETANDALGQADVFMKSIARNAEKFGLNEKALAQFASLSTGITAKEGITPRKNIEFARNILKASPQLGINAFEAQGQITRGLLGGASLGDPAFRAVVQETDVFKEFAKKVGGVTKVTKEFNKLPTVERFNLLNKAFGQFTQNSDLLAKQANTVSSLILRIRQALFGFNGALRPIGEIIQGPVKQALKFFLDFVKGDLRDIIKIFSNTLRQLIPDVETLIIRLQELSAVSRNFKRASLLALITGLLPFISGLGLLNRVLGSGAATGVLGGISNFVARLGGLSGIIARIGPAVGFLVQSFKAFFKPLLIFLTIFQIISRAIAIAKIQDAKAIPELIKTLGDSFNRVVAAFNILFSPINAFIDVIAKGIAPLFRYTFLLEQLTNVFLFLERTFITVIASVSGLLTVLVGLLDSIRNFRFSEVTDFERQKAIFQEGVNRFLTDVFKGAGQLPGREEFVTAQTKIDIGRVEIRNDFKEQQQPDRIAFTLKDQLLKAAQNPTQAAKGQFNLVGGGTR